MLLESQEPSLSLLSNEKEVSHRPEQRAVYSALIYRGRGKAGLDLFPGLASTVPSLEIAFSFSLEKGAQTSVKGGFSEN